MKLPDLLLARGLAQSDTEARGLILAGKVLVNDEPVTKLGFTPPENSDIRIRGLRRFVSRGGEKLDGALAHFGIPVAGRAFMDIGASTGGFTDVLLSRGAAFVAAIDVGKGLLHQKLRTDERVQVIEDCDFKTFNKDQLRQPVEAFVADVSFASLLSLVARAFTLLTPHTRAAEGIVLFKPQFELPRAERGLLDKGVLHDTARAAALIDEFGRTLQPEGIRIAAKEAAAIKGRKGNQEFVLHLVRS